jgi:hypothetical protein
VQQLKRLCGLHFYCGSSLAIRNLQFPQFVKLGLQAMSQRALGTQLVEQFIRFGKRFVVVGAPFKQGVPASRNLFFGQHSSNPLGEVEIGFFPPS